jgi:hypothetical protein
MLDDLSDPQVMRQVQDLIASRFISRADVRAVQSVGKEGKIVWRPDGRYERQPDGSPLRVETYGFDYPAIERHLLGQAVYGTYMLDANSTTKLFCLDIDFDKEGLLPAFGATGGFDDISGFAEAPLREVWLDRRHPARAWMKFKLKTLAHTLVRSVFDTLGDVGVWAAADFSGAKGAHVYGLFPTRVSGQDALEAAQLVMSQTGRWTPRRGDNFWRDVEEDPLTGFGNFTIEVFPKQTAISAGDFGNLISLPLGKNLKAPENQKFFLDLRSPMAELSPRSFIESMTKRPWEN